MRDPVKRIPSTYAPGQWYDEGGKYAVRVWSQSRDTYPHSFRCFVEIKTKGAKANKVRVGRGVFIGNFSPIFVRWQGKEWQVTELLREPGFNPGLCQKCGGPHGTMACPKV